MTTSVVDAVFSMLRICFFPDYDLNTLSILYCEPLPWGDTTACLERFIIARVRRTSIHHIFCIEDIQRGRWRRVCEPRKLMIFRYLMIFTDL